jgi:hypothetical protein
MTPSTSKLASEWLPAIVATFSSARAAHMFTLRNTGHYIWVSGDREILLFDTPRENQRQLPDGCESMQPARVHYFGDTVDDDVQIHKGAEIWHFLDCCLAVLRENASAAAASVGRRPLDCRQTPHHPRL